MWGLFSSLLLFEDEASFSETVRARRRRTRRLAATFVCALIVTASFGIVGIEAVNIVRSYAAGEAQWSKAQKRATIALLLFDPSRGQLDDFYSAASVMNGDTAARKALEQPEPDFAQASAGFLAGKNAPDDIVGLSLGFVLFHNWKPFAAALEDWRRADALAQRLEAIAGDMRALPSQEKPPEALTTLQGKAVALDRLLTRNEHSFSTHMGEASRQAERLILLLLAGESALSLIFGLLLLRSIAMSGERAEERAEESEARTRDFAEVAADWFCELDEDLRIAYISDRFFAEAAPLEGNWVGMPWLEAGRRSNFWSLSDTHRNRVLAHETFHDHRFWLRTSEDRTFHWSISGKPFFHRDGTFAGYRIAASDITVLVRAQEEIAAARDAAERTNRAKSSFLANMGHELRTPLVAVLGFSEIIERETMGPVGNPKYAEYAHDIRTSADHLLGTLNDILDLSAMEAGHIPLREQEFALWDVIDGVLRECRASAAKSGVSLIADLPQTLPCILGDPLRIKQIVVHLISNAVKFTPEGGRVSIGWRREKDGALSIIVRDNGIGMTEENIRRALQPFEQLDSGLNRKFEGLGLGLPLANMLASYHGGTLRFASAPGHGTAVTFTLPAARIMRQKALASA